MSKYIKIDKRQKTFRPIDGCSENIFLMDFILKYSRQNHQPLYMISLGVAKTFDSISHKIILDTLRTAGDPGLMAGYMAGTYRQTSTLQCERWGSHAIHPMCDMMQDLLSSIIVNLVLDRFFACLPEEIGVRVGDCIVNVIGYTDDLVENAVRVCRKE